jgi:sugar lactone lactonase YvrE
MTGVTASATDLWASTDGGLVLELDPFTGQVERTVHLGRVNAIALIYARGQIWVALAPP